MYLIHPIVLFALSAVIRNSVEGAIVVGIEMYFFVAMTTLVCSTLLSGALFLSFERPLLDFGSRWSRRHR